MAIDEPGVPPQLAPPEQAFAQPVQPAARRPERYPVNADFEPAGARNRWWAFPVLGGVAKLIALIPHLIILVILAIAFNPGLGGGHIGLAFLILWFPVLFGGLMPTWGYAFVGGFLRWSTRVSAFLFGMTDSYPPFTMHTATHPVQVTIRAPERNSRWWAFPIVAFYVKQIILIPHIVCLAVLGACALVLWLVMWIPVLIGGRYPAGPYGFVGGVLRWSLRVQTYLAGLTDRYPPFSLS
jgi:hypothetical protein